MGNSRYGALAKTRNWLQVVSLLADELSTGEQVASETIHAARRALLRLQYDPILAHCSFMLTHLAWDSKNDRLAHFLQEVGIGAEQTSSGASLLAALGRHLTQIRSSFHGVNALSEITEAAFLETVERSLSSRTGGLFETGLRDIESAFAEQASPEGFSIISTTFFASFLRRTLGYFISKELPNHVGPARRFDSPGKLAEFNEAIARFCKENARIVEGYSHDWYSLHTYKDRISEKDARAFGRLALEKLANEIPKRGAQG
jgi:hypothetical protein